MPLTTKRPGLANKDLIDAMERMYLDVPPLNERKEVFKYLLKVGFPQGEAERFDCMGRDYELVLKAMKYDKLRQKKDDGVSP